MAEAEISEGKIREALKLLDTEHKELELRKTGLLAYLNIKEHNRELEKQKAALREEIAALKKAYETDKETRAKEWHEREAGFEQKTLDWHNAHEKQREADQRELAGLKASIAKAKKQAAEAENEAQKKIEAANREAVEVLSANEKLVKTLDTQIQEKKDKIAALDEEFRSIAAKHGLGAAA